MADKYRLEDLKPHRGELWDGVPGFIRHYRGAANIYESGLPPLRSTYVAPYIAPRIDKAKRYTDSMICTQRNSLENLSFVKRQLKRDDRELQKLQAEINELTNRPRITFTDEEKARMSSCTPGSDDE